MADQATKPKPLPKPRFLLTDRPKEPFARRLAVLRQEREWWLSDAKIISQYINPRRGLFGREDQRRRRQMSSIIQNEAMMASRTLGNGMHSGLTSPARPWFRLTTPDPDLAEFSTVRDWLYRTTRLMQDIFASSNFYTARQQTYPEVGDFGTAAVIVDQDFDDVVRFTVIPTGQYCLATDEKDRINTFYREFAMTVLQVVGKFGYENCSDPVQQMYDRGSYDALIDIVHVIEPNMQQIKGIKGPMGMPFVCCYYEAKGDVDKLLSFKGYRKWPVATPRWDVQAGEVYGTGCGLIALGDAIGVQLLEKRKAQAIEKLVTPPLQAPVGTTNITHLPGGTTIRPQASTLGITPLYEQNPAGITAVRGEIDGHSERIRRAYFSDLFLMLAQSDRREITAREIEERHEEKLLQLGPVIERQHNEDLNVCVDVTFDIASHVRILPPIPKELEGVDLKVEYVSILAQAQRAVTVGGIERLAGFIGNLAAAKPEVLDKFDFDQTVDEYADAIGTPPALILSDDKVKELRDARAGAEQNAQAMAAMPAVSEAAQAGKVLSETKLGNGGSVLDQVLGVNQ